MATKKRKKKSGTPKAGLRKIGKKMQELYKEGKSRRAAAKEAWRLYKAGKL